MRTLHAETLVAIVSFFAGITAYDQTQATNAVRTASGPGWVDPARWKGIKPIEAVEHGSYIRNHESTVAWFYRILRNPSIDHYRRRTAYTSARETFAAEALVSCEAEVTQTACVCIGDVILDLKSEYRTAIEQVDLAWMSVEAFAKSQDTSVNNASVRLHRARRAVAKNRTTVCGACAELKCLDCTVGEANCKTVPGRASATVQE